ncbi:hypothetical protein [Streptomyces sp. B1I3]|uniref:hypothetical protein n=1 Tax=Streptomyces sp. B1I3 TaxID=3042264 RepID=UPI00278637A6|nr:hypothetical protein [Streptomyces sp. B1I3]MDQ0793012.1 hypothetical protein [Streptomyces sp. B1I3]
MAAAVQHVVPDGTFFDPVPALSGPLPPDPGTVLDTVLSAVFRHTGEELQDDAALLAVTLDAAAGAGTDREQRPGAPRHGAPGPAPTGPVPSPPVTP